MSENVYKDGQLIKTAGAFNVDAALSTSSTNPVQNKVIASEINSLNESLANFDVSGTTVPSGTSISEFCTMVANKLFPQILYIFNYGGIGSNNLETISAPYSSVTYASDGSLLLSSSPNTSYEGSVRLASTKKIDVTDFSKLNIEIYVNDYGYNQTYALGYGATTSSFTNYVNGSYLCSTQAGIHTITFDVSSISGEVYLLFEVARSKYNNDAFKDNVNKLWLEP